MITVNKDAAKQTIQRIYEEQLVRIKAQAERGQEYMTASYFAPSYQIGSAVKELIQKHGIVCVTQGKRVNAVYSGGYDFHITYQLMPDNYEYASITPVTRERIVPNLENRKTYMKDVLADVTKQAQEYADKGLDNFIIIFEALSYHEGSKVVDNMKKLGVRCMERGMGSHKNDDGTYTFSVKFKIN